MSDTPRKIKKCRSETDEKIESASGELEDKSTAVNTIKSEDEGEGVKEDTDPRTDFLLTETGHILLDAIQLMKQNSTENSDLPIAANQ